MPRWARTEDGFAANLDGSDAATAVVFPRLELHSGAGGWQCSCLLGDGTAVQLHARAASRLEAQRALVERARAVLGPEWAAALDALATSR
jgi:hypothetical protein